MPLVEGATRGTGSLMGMAIPLNTASLGSRPTCVSETTFSCCFCTPIDLRRGFNSNNLNHHFMADYLFAYSQQSHVVYGQLSQNWRMAQSIVTVH